VNGATVMIIAGGVLAFALASRRLAGTPLTAAIVFVTLGLVAGTEGLDVLDLDIGSSELRILVEATLALMLFSDAAGLDTRRLAHEAGVPVRLLCVALPLTILTGTLTAVLMFPDLFVFEAVALAVLLAPTDAALGQAVVADRRLPSSVRQGLSVESGLNDGVCVPLLLAAIAFAEVEESPNFDGEVIIDLVSELAIAGVTGAVVGVVIGAARSAAGRRGGIADAWQPPIALIATIVAYVLTVELGGSGFIASFIAGLAYGRTVGAVARRDTELTEQLGQLFSAVTFVLFGAVMVGRGINAFEWVTLAYAVLSLTVVRMAPVAIALVGTGARAPTVALAGWFGPRGLATVVFTLIIVEDSGLPGTQRIVDVATIAVLLSVFAHGLTAPHLVGRYVRWFTRTAPELTFEATPELRAHEHMPRATTSERPSSSPGRT
jgi:NhaP-type Na+/H+ or K+/H+ antiporter